MRWIMCISSIILIILMVGCMSMADRAEQAYLAEVMQSPLQYEIPDGDADVQIARAGHFISEYSAKPVISASDYLIQTQPTDFTHGLEYRVVVVKKKATAVVIISCKPRTLYPPVPDNARLNAHLLSYYMRTGEMPEKRYIYKPRW